MAEAIQTIYEGSEYDIYLGHKTKPARLIAQGRTGIPLQEIRTFLNVAKDFEIVGPMKYPEYERAFSPARLNKCN